MKKTIASSFVLLLAFTFVLLAQNFTVDIAKVPDGTYLGEFRSGEGFYDFSYQASVKVAGGKLVEIKPIKVPNRTVEKLATAEFAKMVKANKVDVDAATKASYKGVVHNALTVKKAYKK